MRKRSVKISSLKWDTPEVVVGVVFGGVVMPSGPGTVGGLGSGSGVLISRIKLN